MTQGRTRSAVLARLPGSICGVRLAAGPPSRWVVTLADGSTVEVWADAAMGLSDDNGDYVFGLLMDIDEACQQGFEVTARTPSNPLRVEVAVARFPRTAVLRVESA